MAAEKAFLKLSSSIFQAVQLFLFNNSFYIPLAPQVWQRLNRMMAL